MVVVGVRDEDADDTERLAIVWLRARVLASLKRRFDLNVDVLSVEIVHDILDLVTSQGNGVATLFRSFPCCLRICVRLQPTHKVAVVLINQRKAAVLEIRLVEQHQPVFQPQSRRKLGAVMCFLVSDAESINRLLGDVVEQVEPLHPAPPAVVRTLLREADATVVRFHRRSSRHGIGRCRRQQRQEQRPRRCRARRGRRDTP